MAAAKKSSSSQENDTEKMILRQRVWWRIGKVGNLGLVRLPSLSLYWPDDPAYVQTFAKSAMSGERYAHYDRVLR